MSDPIFQQAWFRWAIALALGFPLSVTVVNEIIIQLQQRDNPLIYPLRVLRNFLLPILTLLLLLTRVVEIEATTHFIRVLTTALWITVTYITLSSFQVIIFYKKTAESWQSKVPELLLDLLRFFLVACMTAVILSAVWKIDLGGLLTALGVGSLVIGLALQDTLKNLFSGILILFEKPFTIGDWLKVENTIGQVIQVNWRSVYLQTRAREIVVIPNSTLVQGNFTNFSAPTSIFIEYFNFHFSYDDPPNKVKQILLDVIKSTPGVLSIPEPWARVSKYGDFAIHYEVGIPIDGYGGMPGIRNEVVARVWYTAKRFKLTIPYPIEVQYKRDGSQLHQPRERLVEIGNIVRSIPHCTAILDEILAEIKGRNDSQYYAKGERIFNPGDRLAGVYLILSGTVTLAIADASGSEQELAQRFKGELFGVQALLKGARSSVAAIASEDVEVSIVDSEVIFNIMDRFPQLAWELNQFVEMMHQHQTSFSD